MATYYHVWKRSPDGYVNATASSHADARETHLFTFPGRTLNGQPVSFEILLSTLDWEQARERIMKERAED